MFFGAGWLKALGTKLEAMLPGPKAAGGRGREASETPAAPIALPPLIGRAPAPWRNQFPEAIHREMAVAAQSGITPTPIVAPESTARIGAGGRVFKWVVSEEGNLLGLPKVEPGDLIKHSVATGGRPVQAAGNARVQGNRAFIDRRSGHYQPDEASLQIGKQKFEAAGFEVEIIESVI